eukprot:3368586-Alexandrium_andersonii.AAC.1
MKNNANVFPGNFGNEPELPEVDARRAGPASAYLGQLGQHAAGEADAERNCERAITCARLLAGS